MEDKTLVNRVAQSGLVTLDLEQYYPKGEIVAFDLKQFLFMELILKSLESNLLMSNEIAHIIVDPILKTFRQVIDN